jgi:DNA-binding SARP family transcriptional activator
MGDISCKIKIKLRKKSIMSGYKLFCLGRPFLELDEQPLKLEMRKSLALLVYIRMAERAPSRESLAALFWPEFDQRHAQANLRRVLSSLNSSLGPEFLIADREKVGLKNHNHILLDVEDFQQLLESVKTHAHPVEETCSECLSSLEEVVRLYRGDFMEGFNLGDCPEFDEWQYLQRESLRQEFAWVLENLIALYSAKSRWDSAISFARRRVALDQLNEPAQRSLILLYIRAGQRSAALRQYEELASLLLNELGQSPEKETVELIQKIQGSALTSMPVKSKPDIHTAENLRFSEPLLKTKLYIPSLRGEKIPRQRLMNKL